MPQIIPVLPRLPFWASHSDWEADMTEIRVFRGDRGARHLPPGSFVIGWNHYEEERGERFKVLLLLLPHSSCSYIVPLLALVCRDRQMSVRGLFEWMDGGDFATRKKQAQISFRQRQNQLLRRRPLFALSEVTNAANSSSHRTGEFVAQL